MRGGEGGAQMQKNSKNPFYDGIYIHAWVVFYVLCVLCSHPLQNLRWSNNESTNKFIENKATCNMFLFATQSGHAFLLN